MRFRYGIRTLLFAFAVVSILLACAPYLYSLYEVQSRREHTLERLDWSGGSAADRSIRDRIVEAVRTSTYSSLRKPQLITIRVLRHSDLGYSVIADWICHAPIADGIQVTFSDGTTTNVKLIDAYLTQNESDSNAMVLFQGAVYRDEFPAPANQTSLNDVVSIALLSGDDICSNSLPVENP